MTVYMMLGESTVFLTIPIHADEQSPSPQARPRAYRTIGPGESFLGHDYEEIRKLGGGRHELEPKQELATASA